MNTSFICPKTPKSQRVASSFFYALFFLCALFSFSQTQKDSTQVNPLDVVSVHATRMNPKTPMPFSNFSKKEIAKRNLGQDIPILMNFLPSVVTTSDAGNGFGYTGIRVRGSDATRVNVTINGIPYNDSESQGTYFVNMPDFASSLQSIQLQRGAGTSTNGSGAFGASLNMQTDHYTKESNAEISNSLGSFNSRKHTLKFSTGLMNGHFEIAGRLSKLHSDGYIDRAKSDLKSYFVQGTYVGKTTLIKALLFGGTEKTYQSWYGIDEATLNSNRTFNSSGMFLDANGVVRFYDNQTDNYQQDHYQLHWNEKMTENWNASLAFHYTKGKGYYESYAYNEPVKNYQGIRPTKNVADSKGNLVPGTDLVNQKWLDNDFYGSTFSLNYKNEKLDFIFGGSGNKYEGKHFGKVIWARAAANTELGDRYYDDFATKTDGTLFAKITCQIAKKWNLFGDLQYRNVGYKAYFNPSNPVNENFNFWNPKAGITFMPNASQSFYFSYAKAQKEPNRTDFENGIPKPEKLDDFELGWRFSRSTIQINVNGYYMIYIDQLVLTGALDPVGNPIRANSQNSFRRGVELDATINIGRKWILSPNITFSENKNKNVEKLGDTKTAFSPALIAGNSLRFSPIKNIQLSLLSKYVGEQFLSNDEDQNAKLKDYFVQDFLASYVLYPKKVFKSIGFSLLANNVFNANYISNGVNYGGGAVYYFPQAGSNFLFGITLLF